MSKEIDIQRGQTEFLLGISSPQQLFDWTRENPDIIGVAFVGRSNVGKSSTINALFGNKVARVSNTPGRTREVNVFRFPLVNTSAETNPNFYLFDLPGYGHAQVSKQMEKNWAQLMDIFFGNLSQRVAIFNIQDSRHPNTDVDQSFHSYLKSFDNETTLILNKYDKLKKQSERAKLKNLMPKIYQDYKWVKQIHTISAQTGMGVEELKNSLITYLLRKWEADLASLS